MPLLSKVIVKARQFLADDRGSAGIEFLMTLPLLIGVLLFTAEYGNALRAKMVLNTATADAARFLARSPIYEDATGKLDVYPTFYNQAGNLVAGMIGGPVNISVLVYKPLPEDSGLRTDPVLIRVEANATLSMPLLGFINNTLEWAGQFAIGAPETPAQFATSVPLTSVKTAPWSAGSEIGAAECTIGADGVRNCDAAEAGT